MQAGYGSLIDDERRTRGRRRGCHHLIVGAERQAGSLLLAFEKYLSESITGLFPDFLHLENYAYITIR
jgi:hypothetical protein